MVCTRVALGTAPITASIFCPFLKTMTVGMLRMPYSVATAGLSSVLIFSCRREKGRGGRGRRELK